MTAMRSLFRTIVPGLGFFLACASLQGKEINRILPPEGMAVPTEVRDALQKEIESHRQAVARLQSSDASQQTRHLLPDVEVFLKGVDYALRGNELYSLREIGWAKRQLKLAGDRCAELTKGKHSWTTERGLVVRGFRSALDDSVQPFGLVIPQALDLSKPAPLYVWLHGRGDKVLDVQFIEQRLTSPGQIQPDGAIVLHPFGRYCNGYKSAGEVDVLEAIEAVCSAYAIDRERIVLCGFSMGGAGVWHLGAHYPDRWAAMSPGAGFVDVRRYQNLRAEQYPPWYEQALWGMYDVPDYARNLLNVPLVAYSGELDKQKAAADLMEVTLQGEGLAMTHIVGKGVGHKYEPSALKEVLDRLHGFEDEGIDCHPQEVHLQTRTLRYGRCHWVCLLGLGEHWREARVDARRVNDNRVEISTSNVTRFALESPWKDKPAASVTIIIDERSLTIPAAGWKREVILENGPQGWNVSAGADGPRLAKVPGLQGPIDDAFLTPFVVVRPTIASKDPIFESWVTSEREHFKERWRTLFRGEVREVRDVDVTDEMMARNNLILWGDPASNQVISRIANDLPIGWTADELTVTDKSWPAVGHALVMIYPNPLPAGRGRYVVLNSGITFREAHDRTNSLQNPKLPDWAILDLSISPDAERAGEVIDAGFFDENWQYQVRRTIGEQP
jgi:hypothetical protein